MNYTLSLVCAVLCALNVFSQPLQVIGTSPVAQSLITAPGDEIFIMFNEPLDEATVTLSTFQVYGRWSGPMEALIAFLLVEL